MTHSESLKGQHVPIERIVERLEVCLDAESGLGRVRKGDHAAAVGVLISHVHDLALLDGLGGLAEAEATKGGDQAVSVMRNGPVPRSTLDSSPSRLTARPEAR